MQEKIKIKGVLEGMKLGEEKEFPAEKFRSVTVSCSDYGFISGRKYSVRKDWIRRVVKVKRIS